LDVSAAIDFHPVACYLSGRETICCSLWVNLDGGIMQLNKLREYLDQNGAKYTVTTHSPAYTAQEIAKAADVTGKMMAKVVMIKVDAKLTMLVLPAHEKVDFDALRVATGARDVALAREEEFSQYFKDCETGAMPPFGNLYGIDVFVSEDLHDRGEIVFNGCSFRELVRMRYDDFVRLVRPKVLGKKVTTLH
jgi:Ala-tRNA(Pro) deacylase